MIKCNYCKEPIENMPHECRHCGKVHCHKHILPESHECKEQKKYSEIKKSEWQRKAKDLLMEDKKIETKYSSTKSFDEPYLSEIKYNKNKKHKKNNSSSNFRKSNPRGETKFSIKENLGVVFLIIVLIFASLFIYFIWNIYNTYNDKIVINDLSKQAFDYVNTLRNEKGLANLEYEIIIYPSLLNVSKEKSKDKDNIFMNSYEISQELSKYNNLTKKGNSYINMFFIEGGGFEKFRNILDKDYQARKLIVQSKYKKGAVACNLDYCTLILYEGEITPYEKNTSDNTLPYDLSEIVLRNYNSSSVNESSSNLSNEKIFNSKSEDKLSPSTKFPLQPEIDIYSLEKEIHELINEKRKEHGLNSLSWDSKLSDVARGHSQDMAENNYFEHTNLQGQEPTDRANAKGYSCYKDFGSYYIEGIAENIFQNNLYDSVSYGFAYVIPYYIHDWNTISEIAESTVSGWMLSSGHRENILTSSYDKEGIGVAISDDDKVYITENFC